MSERPTPLVLSNGRYWRVDRGQRLLRTSLTSVAAWTVAINSHSSTLSLLATLLGVGASLSFLLGLARKAPVTAARVSVDANDKELVFTRDPADEAWPATVELSRVREAWIEPLGTQRRVWLVLRGGERLSVELATHDDALALLRAVRCAAEQRVFKRTFSQRALAATLFAVGFVASTCVAVSLSSLYALWLGLLATALLWVITRPLRVQVGAEGVRLSVSVWRYFVRYDELSAVLAEDGYLVLVLGDGRRVKYYCGAHPELLGTVIERIAEALAAHAHKRPSDRVAQLRRGGVPVSRWREMLREMLFSSSPMRTMPLSREDLVRVVASADAPAEERIGAALALGAAPREEGNEQAPERVRVALDGCASDVLRAALQSALEGGLTEAQVDAAVHEERSRRAPQ